MVPPQGAKIVTYLAYLKSYATADNPIVQWTSPKTLEYMAMSTIGNFL
ncbi:MAG: hypothetical protein JRI38_06310 [Deltaproteobacteria bacterium]|nr:hypothetical protein [Deltaproteobacteria bacterium]